MNHSSKEKVIVFGCGKLGKRSIPTIELTYSIRFFVDNDCKKWGEMFEGYVVKSPESMIDYEDRIIIATGWKNAEEITEKILVRGIKKERILLYFCYKESMDEILPYEPVEYHCNNKTIKEFDLIKREEAEYENGKRIAVFAHSYSVYPVQLIIHTKRVFPTLHITLITASAEYYGSVSHCVDHIYVYQTLGEVIEIIKGIPQYDVFQLLEIFDYWVYLRNLLKLSCDRLCLMMQGSDFYRAKENELEQRVKLIKIVDCMSVQSEDVMKDFVRVFPEVSDRMMVVNYGLEVLDHISEHGAYEKTREEKFEYFNLPISKMIVTCGHNSGEAHQHMAIIEAVSRIDKELRDGACFVFPMTYGNGGKEYIGKIEELLDEKGINFKIMTEFMNFDEMAMYADISDIMIHVQTTDQLSSTMLEEMYAGSVVIAGDWLPYKWLREKGVYFLSVANINQLTKLIEDVLREYAHYREKCEGNGKIIYELCSWDIVMQKWMTMWQLEASL